MNKASKVSLIALSLCGALGPGVTLVRGQGGWDLGGTGTLAMDERLLEARSSLERSRARQGEIASELASIEPRRSELSKNLARHGRALYRVSRGGMLPIAGGFEALLGHASRVGRLERLVSGELKSLDALRRKKISLQTERIEIEARIAAAQREVTTLEQARVGISQQLLSQRMFDAAFVGAQAASAPDERPSYGLSVVGGVVTERFAEQRGNLALPVSGPSTIQDARRAESDGPGIEMVAQRGAAVRAAAAGRVAFSGPYGSYGQLVILDHGDRFYSVYGGLGRVEVQVGDDLSKSARLGVAGADPVYFEVRKGTRTQDARTWLGL